MKGSGHNPVQQGTPRALCLDCGASIGRVEDWDDAGRARYSGPPPRRCPACKRVHRRRAQLRAYLASAAKLAVALGNEELGFELHRLAERGDGARR